MGPLSKSWFDFFYKSYGKDENDRAGSDVKNGVWQKVIQYNEVVHYLNSGVTQLHRGSSSVHPCDFYMLWD